MQKLFWRQYDGVYGSVIENDVENLNVSTIRVLDQKYSFLEGKISQICISSKNDENGNTLSGKKSFFFRNEKSYGLMQKLFWSQYDGVYGSVIENDVDNLNVSTMRLLDQKYSFLQGKISQICISSKNDQNGNTLSGKKMFFFSK